jgi:hypothetical protein
MPLESIYLKRRIGFDDFSKRMIFQTLVIPDLRCLDECDKNEIFPVAVANFILFADVENSGNINIGDEGCFFLHFAGHHDELYKILDVFPCAGTKSLILVLVVEAREVVRNRLRFVVKQFFTLLVFGSIVI